MDKNNGQKQWTKTMDKWTWTNSMDKKNGKKAMDQFHGQKQWTNGHGPIPWKCQLIVDCFCPLELVHCFYLWELIHGNGSILFRRNNLIIAQGVVPEAQTLG